LCSDSNDSSGSPFHGKIFQGDPKFVASGKITEEGLGELQTRMPYADLKEFRKDPRLDKLEDLFTVDLIVNYLESRVNAK